MKGILGGLIGQGGFAEGDHSKMSRGRGLMQNECGFPGEGAGPELTGGMW